MLHLIYIVAFTIIAFLAVSNLIRSLITVSMDSQRRYPERGNSGQSAKGKKWKNSQKTIHPELLDDRGKPINEPLLVMRSVSVEDARQQLDAIYNASPSPKQETEEE
ncbi:MAG: DUF2973 domain-containing protein [Crocosphaera sp.]|nr:DUF2973 domain-containing protein [Crocosphaera sp.]